MTNLRVLSFFPLLVMTTTFTGVACGDSASTSPPASIDASTDGDDASHRDPDTGSPDDGGHLPSNTITVKGTLSTVNGTPLAHWPVQVGTSALVLSDADGHFTATDVSPPYDVVIVASDPKGVVVYQGLTRTDPMLVVFGLFLPTRGTELAGQLKGATYPESGTTRTLVQFAEREAYRIRTNASGDGTFRFRAMWSGETRTVGDLYALQYTHANGADIPLSYTGFVQSPGVTVNGDGDLLTIGALTMGPAPGAATVSGTVSLPAGYEITEKSVEMTANGNPALYLLRDGTDKTKDFSYLVPTIAGMKARVNVETRGPNGESSSFMKNAIDPGTTGIHTGILPAPSIDLPADQATGVTVTTPFSWSKFEGGVHLLTAFPANSGIGFIVVTEKSTTTLEGITRVGFSLTPATTYGWQVVGIAPYASVDAFTSADGFVTTLTKETYQANSVGRTFTTPP